MTLDQFDKLKVGSKIKYQGTVEIVSAVEAYPAFKGHGPDGKAVHSRNAQHHHQVRQSSRAYR